MADGANTISARVSKQSRRWKLGVSIAGGIVVLFAAALVAAYLIDTGDDDPTLRGLILAGHQAGHLTADELARVISRVDAEVADIPVRIDLPDRTETFAAAELGITVDRPATTEAALRAGKEGNAWDRFVAWLASFTSVRRVEPVLTYDRERARQAIASLDDLVVEEPQQPRLVLGENATLEMEPGIGVGWTSMRWSTVWATRWRRAGRSTSTRLSAPSPRRSPTRRWPRWPRS